MRPCGSSTHSKVPYVPRTCHSDEHETSKQNAHCSRLPGNPEVYCQLSPPWVPRLPPPRRDARGTFSLLITGLTTTSGLVITSGIKAFIANGGRYMLLLLCADVGASSFCSTSRMTSREFERLSTILNCSFTTAGQFGRSVRECFLLLACVFGCDRRRVALSGVRSRNGWPERPQPTAGGCQSISSTPSGPKMSSSEDPNDSIGPPA